MDLISPVFESFQETKFVPQEVQVNLCTFIGLLVLAPPTHSLADFRFSVPHLGHRGNSDGETNGLDLSSLATLHAAMMQKPIRPTGVTILAVLEFIISILGLLGGIGLIAGSSYLVSAGAYAGSSSYLVATGGFLLVVAILALAVGWGMWTGKGWAWTVGIILAAVGIVSSLLSFTASSIITIIIDLIIIYYLTRPHIRAYFGKGGTTQTMAPSTPAPTTTP